MFPEQDQAREEVPLDHISADLLKKGTSDHSLQKQDPSEEPIGEFESRQNKIEPKSREEEDTQKKDDLATYELTTSL